jgi:dihydroorotate dehydrogenase
MAGATAVEIGCATFARPQTMTDIIEGIARYMETSRIGGIGELKIPFIPGSISR